MKYKPLITGLLLLLMVIGAAAQNPSETRSYMKTFPVGKETTLEVTNKYGTIEITTWKKDSAYIRAELKAYAPTQEKLTPLFDGITIDIKEAGSVLRAQTLFAQSFSRLFEGFKGMTSKIISYDSRMEINYYINVPEYLNLKIDNRYGDVYMENCSGKMTASVANGSFRANNLSKESNLILSFCDATVSSIQAGKIEASFSEITVEKAGNISISSISSKYNLTEAGEINCESRRDKFYIDNIKTVNGTAYFTDYIIKSLSRGISLVTKYGTFEAEKIEDGFDAINMNSGYSDIRMTFPENVSYSFDIRHVNTFLSMPSKNIKSEEKAINEERKEYITFGTVGTNPGSSKMKLDASRGKIYIK